MNLDMQAEEGPDNKKRSQEYNDDQDSKGTGSIDKEVEHRSDDKKHYQKPDY